MDWRHRLAVMVLCVQLLLALHSYRSTDFEVHRNWLAITHSLPMQQWYTEATSEWTLDYPPLFAWFEWAMAHVAALFDPKMLQVSSLEYASDATVLFQRLSVCVTSLVLVAAMLRATNPGKGSVAGVTLFALVVANAGLIMVDNIHFQYNSILMGILVFSILLLEEQRYILGGVLFAVLLNMKHLFAYLAPVYFVFLLKHYVLAGGGTAQRRNDKSSSGGGSSWLAAVGRLVMLGGAVLAVCAASFGPFVAMGQIKQVLSRLFPFARGLCHAYWAPNAWALYSFVDKVAAAAAAKAGLIQPPAAANMAGGVVGVSSFVVLPNIGAGTTAVLVLLAMLPCLVALWKAPKQQALSLLAPAVAYASLCGFMWGYHVHEKAALTVEVPMALAAVRSAEWGRQYVLLSTAAHVGIFPLLFQTQELPIRWLLAGVYFIGCVWGLASIHTQGQQQAQKRKPTGHAAAATPAKQQQQHNGAAGSSGSPAAASPSPVGVRTRRQLAQRQQRQQQQVQEQRPAAEEAVGPQPAVAGAAGGVAGALSMRECLSWLPLQHRLYLAGLVLLELYCTWGHTALFAARLPFVPLMLTSVYCAVGFTWVWAWMAGWFVQQC